MRYTPNAQKAVEAILWLASEHPQIDVYHVVKSSFYADKHHVQHYGRPILGDRYDAAPWGPLPQVVYGILRRNPLEILALESNGYVPIGVDDAFRVRAERAPNLRVLSETDVEALGAGLRIVRDKSFGELVEMTHEDPAYIAADGGEMDYRNFLDPDDPDREEKAADLEEVSGSLVF